MCSRWESMRIAWTAGFMQRPIQCCSRRGQVWGTVASLDIVIFTLHTAFRHPVRQSRPSGNHDCPVVSLLDFQHWSICLVPVVGT